MPPFLLQLFHTRCVFVISVCDPVLGDHGSMVRFIHYGAFVYLGDLYCLLLHYHCCCILGCVFSAWWIICDLSKQWLTLRLYITHWHGFFLRDLHRLQLWRCSVYVLWLQAVLSFHSTFLRIFIRSIRTRWFLLLTLSLLTSLRLSEYNVFFILLILFLE